MQKFAAILAALSLFSVNAAVAGNSGNKDYPEPTGWELTYKTKYDDHGNYVVADGYYGLDELLKRMKKGWSVMVVYKHNDVYKKLPCEEVLVKYDRDYPQYWRGACVNNSEISLETDHEYNWKFQYDAYHFFQIVNTTGKLYVSRWYVGEHSPKGEDAYQVEVKWYTKK